MFKRLSAITLFFTLLFVPFTVLAAGGGGGHEEAAAEPSGLVMTLLMILSFATVIYMMYLAVTDNG